MSPTLLAYVVQSYGGERSFLLARGLRITAGALFARIDASKRILAGEEHHAHQF